MKHWLPIKRHLPMLIVEMMPIQMEIKEPRFSAVNAANAVHQLFSIAQDRI